MATAMLTQVVMAEWPQEYRYRQNNAAFVHQRLSDIPAPLIDQLQSSQAFGILAAAVLQAFDQKADPKSVIAKLSADVDQPDAFGEYDETVRQAVLGLAGVDVLRHVATPEMWEYLWSLARHSAPLEQFLPEAVIAAASEVEFRDRFFAIARSVVQLAAQHPGRRAIDPEKGVGANAREHWRRGPQLSSLWQGRFDRTAHSVDRDDDHVLSIVAEMDPAVFVSLLSLYDYPEPVAHALIWCGAMWRFERWREVASAAPTAFGERGQWNGSVILPILLSIASEQSKVGLEREPTADAVAKATAEIRTLAAGIVETIAPRPDYIGCAMRWGNWLVRNCTMGASAPNNAVPVPTDAKSGGFVEAALLDALIIALPSNCWGEEPAPDAEAWEPWCHFGMGVLIAHEGKVPMPSTSAFLKAWSLTAEEWSSHKGTVLRAIASPFEAAGVRADGYGARVLALPMVESDEPANKVWKRFWQSSDTLREIVEFGDADAADEGGWHGTMEAARLLMFQFSIGLMMLDHLILPQSTLTYDRRISLEALLPVLDNAVREMAAIDRLNGKFWSEALRHLAIRRAAWLANESSSDRLAISPDAKPTLADFVQNLAGDTEGLLVLAYVAQRNGVERSALLAAFTEAKVDIETELAIAKRLLAISPRAISLTADQLKGVHELLATKSGNEELGKPE
jgi:hypothetical protein